VLAYITQKNFACGRETHPARVPLENASTQFFFQILNAAIQCRCRDMQLFGSAANRAFPDNHVNVVKQAQVFHGQPLKALRFM
jgi:hypothetical protein